MTRFKTRHLYRTFVNVALIVLLNLMQVRWTSAQHLMSCSGRFGLDCFSVINSTGSLNADNWQPSKPGIERVQALADISRSALCCHSNEIHAPIANPPNSAQLGGTPYHSSKVHPVRAVMWWTDRQIHRRPWPIYILPRLCLARNVIKLQNTRQLSYPD